MQLNMLPVKCACNKDCDKTCISILSVNAVWLYFSSINFSFPFFKPKVLIFIIISAIAKFLT